MSREIGPAESRMVSAQADLIAELRRDLRASEAREAALRREVSELKNVVVILRRGLRSVVRTGAPPRLSVLA
jgi:hypothetical protein